MAKTTKLLTCNANSSCLGDPDTDLYVALTDLDKTTFSDVLNSGEVDPNKVQDNGETCLEYACKHELVDFVSLLLETTGVNTNINQLNETTGYAPIHIVAELGSTELIQMFVANDVDVNQKNEFGKTALQIVVEKCCGDPSKQISSEERKRYQKCLITLLNSSNVEINTLDNKGRSPLYVAASKKNAIIVRYLLKYGADDSRRYNGHTLKELINQNTPLLLSYTTGKREPLTSAIDVDSSLYDALQNEELLKFKMLLEDDNCNLDKFHGSFTCLQFACNYGMEEFVFLMLDKKVNPNCANPTTHWYPVHYSADRGYYSILKKLLESGAELNVRDNRGDTALHKVIRKGAKALTVEKKDEYERCLRLILDSKPIHEFDINARDALGNTPLHYAVLYSSQENIKLLLKNGANCAVKNNQGECPIRRIPPATMESFLNDCIQMDDKYEETNEDFSITFDYNFLGPPLQSAYGLDNSGSIPLPETEALWYMAQYKEHQQHLKHPVIRSFLDFKWLKVKKYFWINCLFYITFVILLTSYILTIFKSNESKEKESDNAQDTIEFNTPHPGLWYGILFFTVFLIVREIFQMIVAPIRYFFLIENLLEWAMIILTCLILSETYDMSYFKRIAALCLLLSWAEMVMILGRIPVFSTYVRMFMTVSLNFITFIFWYTVLIIAFALSFYILFSPTEPFNTPFDTIMKTIVMMTGEFDYGDIPLTQSPGTAHFVFLCFIFLITIVLMNLLTGLAVSDTQTIRDEAKIVGLIGRVELISYSESMLLGDPFSFLANYPPFKWIPRCAPCRVMTQCLPIMKLLNCMGKEILLFHYWLPSKKLIVLPNKHHKISPENCKCDFHVNGSIVKHAIAIAANERNNPQTNIQMLKSEVTSLKQDLQKVEKQMARMVASFNRLNFSLRK